MSFCGGKLLATEIICPHKARRTVPDSTHISEKAATRRMLSFFSLPGLSNPFIVLLFYRILNTVGLSLDSLLRVSASFLVLGSGDSVGRLDTGGETKHAW